MPEMVMQMPGRHGSLCAPFLMDQIIQNAFRTIPPLCRAYIWKSKEHFCSFARSLVGCIMKHAIMREALFKWDCMILVTTWKAQWQPVPATPSWPSRSTVHSHIKNFRHTVQNRLMVAKYWSSWGPYSLTGRLYRPVIELRLAGD